MPFAHLEIGSPVIPIYSASEPAPCLGSELLFAGTQMTIDMTKAYCDGFQTTEESPDGWGNQSVNTMVT